MSIASLVLGIVGICITLFSAGSLGIVGTLCGAAGIVCGILAWRSLPVRRRFTANALLLSLISAGLGLALFFACSAIAAQYAAGL